MLLPLSLIHIFGLAQPLPLALDEAAFALQLMQQLSGLLVGAAQGLSLIHI